jgi:uncharacterized protein YigA (DUF484 family)
VTGADNAVEWTDIREQLLADPERVRGDEGLLQALGLRITSPNVIDFGPAALSRLEAARDREMTARQEIEVVARANFAAQAQTHALAVELMEARNTADLARRVHDGAIARFGVAAGALIVEEPGAPPVGWRGAPSGLIDLILCGRDHRMGDCPGLPELFGEENAPGIQSAGLVRLHLWSEGRPGLLAFGSAEPEGFTRDMGAELVSFLARVVERTAGRWPPID